MPFMGRQKNPNGLPSALNPELPNLGEPLRPRFTTKIAYRYIIVEIKL